MGKKLPKVNVASPFRVIILVWEILDPPLGESKFILFLNCYHWN